MNRAAKPNRGIEIIAPPLPCSPEVEEHVLGTIILDERAYEETALLKPEDFFVNSNREIFLAMRALREGEKPITLVTVCEKLEKLKRIESVGGAGYVSKLIDGIPYGSNLEHYVRILREKSLLRGLIHATNLVQQQAFEGATEEAVTSLETLQEVVVEYATPKTLGKTSRMARLSLIQSFEQKDSLLRVNVGIGELDKATGGFRAGELVTITASVTGSGKTLFAQQIKCNACKEGLHGLYFSGEMPAEQLASREIATETGVPHWKMRRPEKLTPEEYNALFENAAKDCDVCRTIDGEFSIKDIRVACMKQKRAGNLSWVVIDYDELVDAPGKDEFAQQRYVIREAKRIAMKCQVPVFVISGLRKSLDKSEAKKPTLERIYGSGAKSKHSSFILFVDREYVRELKGDETKARVCVLKARDGKVGEIPLTFDVQKLRFREETEEEAYNRMKKKAVAAKAGSKGSGATGDEF